MRKCRIMPSVILHLWRTTCQLYQRHQEVSRDTTPWLAFHSSSINPWTDISWRSDDVIELRPSTRHLTTHKMELWWHKGKRSLFLWFLIYLCRHNESQLNFHYINCPQTKLQNAVVLSNWPSYSKFDSDQESISIGFPRVRSNPLSKHVKVGHSCDTDYLYFTALLKVVQKRGNSGRLLAEKYFHLSRFKFKLKINYNPFKHVRKVFKKYFKVAVFRRGKTTEYLQSEHYLTVSYQITVKVLCNCGKPLSAFKTSWSWQSWL